MSTSVEKLAELAHLSAGLGRDPEQVQAAGGNTSIKIKDLLWVKASGLWLADAETRPSFVPVRLGAVQDGIAADLADPVGPAVEAGLNAEGLRPSIETTMHALLPHPVVIHTHSVRTLALAIREDAERLLAERLDHLAWTFVPYAHPGLPLTRAIDAKLRRGRADVLVLGNHGLVVGGDGVEAAASLLAEVERRLDTPARLAETQPAGTLGALAAPLGLRPVRHAKAHGIAMDPERVAWATGGSRYPDHVIFLGPSAATLPPIQGKATRAEVEAVQAGGQRLFLVPGMGTLLPSDAPEAADELALCLALVLERVPSRVPLTELGPAAEAALLGWDAEKYRQSLARARSSSGS
jgi:rhamnose utilization protein RhaD (predicted bifunctional aldolase and dehydrogenase)